MRNRRSPRFKQLVRSVGLVRAVGGWRSDLTFRRWKANHPDGTYADFYAHSVLRKIGRGEPHLTLGARGWSPGHGPAVDWDSDTFAERGMRLWHQILAFGLKPDMRCVDYGCGSLRLGQHAIWYLDRRNYWGIDVVGAFIEQGLKLIGPEPVEAKQPHLDVIDDGVLADIARWRPNFIFSNAVVQHVPPSELGPFFERLARMMTSDTRAYVLFISASRRQRVKAMNWAYPAGDLVAVMAEAGLSATIGKVDPAIRRVDGRDREVLEIRLSS